MHSWMSGKRELLFAHLRVGVDLLQMTGLLMSVGSFEPQWLVVSMIAYIGESFERAVLVRTSIQ